MFNAVQSKSVSQLIVEQIQNMIFNGELRSGDQLPPERELSERLSVSRPALREALKALEVMGLVESHQGSGTFIVNKVENQFLMPLSLSFKLDEGKLSDILAFRRMIECFTVSAAASMANEEDIEDLQRIHEELSNESDMSVMSSIDRAFHNRIAQICNNPLIMNTLSSASHLLDVFASESTRISFFEDDNRDNTISEHQEILDAIAAHDTERAEKAIKHHLSNIHVEYMQEHI